MTDHQAEILELTVSGVDRNALSEDDRFVLSYLSRELNYCEPENNELANTVYFITQRGETALSQFKKERDKEAEDKQQKRLENQISIARILVDAVIFILGLVVEYRTGVVSFIFQLFG